MNDTATPSGGTKPPSTTILREAGSVAYFTALAALLSAFLLSLLLIFPSLPLGCGGVASHQIAIIGTFMLAIATVLFLVLRNTPNGRAWLLLILLMAVAGHGSLMAVRPGDMCTPCKFVFGLEALTLLETFLWVRAVSRLPLTSILPLGDSLRYVLASATVGAVGLGAIVDAGKVTEVLADEDLRTHLATREGKSDAYVMHVILREGCSACEDYERHHHRTLLEALPPDVGVRIHQNVMPDQPPPRALPCIIFTSSKGKAVLARIDGARSAESVIGVIERIERLRRETGLPPPRKGTP